WTTGYLLNTITWTRADGKPVSVSLVQGNIPQSIKWSPDSLQLSLDRYTQLSEPLWGKNRLIVWPEAAIPLPLQDAYEFIEAIDNKAKANDTYLLLGIPIHASADGYYNAIQTLGKEQKAY